MSTRDARSCQTAEQDAQRLRNGLKHSHKAAQQRSAAQERAAGRTFVRGLTLQQVGDLGDALVLGDFDWREWGLAHKPSAAFLRAADEERILREDEET